MSDVRLVFHPDQLEALRSSPQTAEGLGHVARQIERRVHAPRHLTVHSRWGTGPHGAYAQVIMRGPGAISWEFGNRHQSAHAPIRNALRGVR